MRVYGPGDFKFHGADLGILVTKGPSPPHWCLPAAGLP
jgi:hypothetical protein